MLEAIQDMWGGDTYDGLAMLAQLWLARQDFLKRVADTVQAISKKKEFRPDGSCLFV